MRSKLVLTIALMLAVSGAVLGTPLDKRVVGGDSLWLLHADFDAFWGSTIGRKAELEMAAEERAKIDAIKELMGVDLTRDIYGMTLFGRDSEDENAAAVIYGRFNHEKILALMKLSGNYTATEYEGHVIHYWYDGFKKRNQVGSFVGEGMMVVSRGEGAVKWALDVLDGKMKSLAESRESPLWSMSEVAASTMMVAAAYNLSELTEEDDDQAAILQNSEQISFVASEENGVMKLVSQLETESGETAEQVEQFLNGIKAYTILKKKEMPEVSAIIGACNVSRSGNGVRLEFGYPSEELFYLIKVIKGTRIDLGPGT